jgi:phosphatidylglycerophosphatase A
VFHHHGNYVPAFVPQLVVIAVIFAIGIPICTVACRQLGVKDPGMVVYDEWAVMPLVFLLVPLESPWVWLAGFGLFRLFDISKPPPIKKLENLPEGLGVMVDDLMAAVYANIALQLVVRFGPLAVG